MELLKIVARRRSLLSETIYVLLNVGLAIGVWLLVVYFNSPWLAYGLILVSKWRTLSVRPRFWFANVQANGVDIFVGLSVATILWQAGGSPVLQTLITLGFVGWLLYLKPRSSKFAIITQAGVAQFLALVSVFILGYQWDVTFAVLIAWIAGYSASRHILSSFEEKETILLSFIWGFVIAELAWVAFHWNIAYNIPLLASGLKIPQIAIIASLLGYIAQRYYRALSVDVGDGEQKPNVRILLWPTLFVGFVCLILLTAFNGYDATSL